MLVNLRTSKNYSCAESIMNKDYEGYPELKSLEGLSIKDNLIFIEVEESKFFNLLEQI